MVSRKCASIMESPDPCPVTRLSSQGNCSRVDYHASRHSQAPHRRFLSSCCSLISMDFDYVQSLVGETRWQKELTDLNADCKVPSQSYAPVSFARKNLASSHPFMGSRSINNGSLRRPALPILVQTPVWYPASCKMERRIFLKLTSVCGNAYG